MCLTLYIYRAPCFSPNAVEKDRAVLDAVRERRVGDSRSVAEEELTADLLDTLSPSVIIHMCRSKRALEILKYYKEKHQEVVILNAPDAILGNSRKALEDALLALHLHTPSSLIAIHPELAGKGYWVKQTDTSDSSEKHVYFTETMPLETTASQIVQPHIEGTCVKFYGVRKTGFFHAVVSENSSGAHGSLSESIEITLSQAATQLANRLNLDIYGGDAIVTSHGDFAIIDFNDFPSFSACREEAAEAISLL